uniref:Uncharacterized protein n=1 Tax=Arundo donax TaxID=35708 RepID=A0A0A9S9F0_ARUDO
MCITCMMLHHMMKMACRQLDITTIDIFVKFGWRFKCVKIDMSFILNLLFPVWCVGTWVYGVCANARTFVISNGWIYRLI